MKVWTTIIGLLAVLTPLTAAWSKEDREIFRVRDELATALGPDVTFYDFVGVSSSASLDDINKAYRKKTRSLHPDKVKQQLAAERAKTAKKNGGVPVTKQPSSGEVRAAVKRASDMQARLGIVTNILRGPERDRYDHFLSNGFPTWKGTEYYYNRYRPGFGTVMVGLFVFIGGAIHYLTLYMGWKRQREFVDRYIRYARQAAWGNQLAGMDLNAIGTDPTAAPAAEEEAGSDAQQQQMAMNRKQRRMQERDAKRDAAKDGNTTSRRGRRGVAGAGAASSGTATPTPQAAAGPTGAKRRVTAENGKVLVVDSLGDVYLEQMDAEGKVEELLLDINEVVRPTIFDTAVYRLPAWAFSLTVGRVFAKKTADEDEFVSGAANDDDSSSDSSPGKATPSSDSQDEFEVVEKSGAAQTTGSSHNKVKANKRKGKKK
ncbi:hypothetical protein F503_08355 [Ophiostoma piceae UAMH 11346]|uniref:J domain-containing protein n=1 Tax=Ophiostoma piceae (strain UAMH 11346) TaxID=1262450 RepID=S3BX49_OPHP1|nr:hypothetical protein F503_08355 [Ophiostoma piceae UAMH 11346]